MTGLDGDGGGRTRGEGNGGKTAKNGEDGEAGTEKDHYKY